MIHSSVPRVSVVVPAYNNADYIHATIESVLAQDFEDFELVIADHSSSDDTASVLSRYASLPRVRILEATPAGGGALANWNRVSEQARAEYLKLLCGDDLLAPSALGNQVAALDAHPSAVLVASQRDLIDASGKVVIRGRGLGSLDGLVSGKDAVRASVLAGTNIFGEPGCVMFRREVLEREGGWDARFPYLIDQASYSRIMLHGDMVALRCALASFRINAGQWSVRLTKQQAAQAQAFHGWLRAEYPDLLSPTDEKIGNFRAWMAALTRRAAYVWLRHRM